jgi:hypothetical protein
MVETGRINELQSIPSNQTTQNPAPRPQYKAKFKPRKAKAKTRRSYSSYSDTTSESEHESEDEDEEDEYHVENQQPVEVSSPGDDSEADAEGESVASSLVEVDHSASLHLYPISSSRNIEPTPQVQAKKGPSPKAKIPKVGPFSSAPLDNPAHPPAWSVPSYTEHYASLSAGPNPYPQPGITSQRKRHISDGSSSSNTRSVSGNSNSTDASTYLATPVASDLYPSLHHSGSRASFGNDRRSRSRVNELLDERDTQASWVEGHNPGQGFHIGSSSSSSYPSYKFDVPPPLSFQIGDVAPSSYDLAQNAWDVGVGDGAGTGYALLPHMNMEHMGEGEGEGFRLPLSYDFTYAEVVTE